ncbi:MAG: hypothetical protein HKN25_02975, partial [Pyrinomonadaceae bacterium]|nr:hypothetical protein [Pyrinomonadaceae bacterium]
MNRIEFTLIVGFLILLLAAPASAQALASLDIIIVDRRSDSIDRGEVRILNPDGNVLERRSIPNGNSTHFANLAAGEKTIEIESPGFELFVRRIFLKTGSNKFKAALEIQKIEANVEIELPEIDRRLRALSGILSREEIDSLPDDPREIKKELKRRFGNDISIRIDGFAGGQIPPKNLIRSIQVNSSSFDAEFHALGSANVNVNTKASIPGMLGMVTVKYGNSALNARNALAREKLPKEDIDFTGFLTGPIAKGASFLASYNKSSRSQKHNILARTELAPESLSGVSKTNNRNFSGTFSRDIGEGHTIRVSYQSSASKITNAGVGGLR